MTTKDLKQSWVAKITGADGKEVYVMAIQSGDQPRCVGMSHGEVYEGEWPVTWIAPKGTSFTIVVGEGPDV